MLVCLLYHNGGKWQTPSRQYQNSKDRAILCLHTFFNGVFLVHAKIPNFGHFYTTEMCQPLMLFTTKVFVSLTMFTALLMEKKSLKLRKILIVATLSACRSNNS